jgi:hypothetical protein
MKKLFSTLFSLGMFASAFSQGQIISITTNPTNPTTNDFVEVYVELMFTSGGCDVDNQGLSTIGLTTTASAHHCVGMLAVICDVTDTFDLGYLQAGNHTFNLTLSSGSGGPGCSPGIVPDDTGSFNFTVTQALGIEDPANNTKVTFYPNPMNEMATLKINGSIDIENLRLEILDATGRVVMVKENISSNEILIENKNLELGIYFYRLTGNDKLIATDKFVVE